VDVTRSFRVRKWAGRERIDCVVTNLFGNRDPSAIVTVSLRVRVNAFGGVPTAGPVAR